jgi:hypothetical protein
MPFCVNCGANTPAGAIVCAQCGAATGQTAGQQRPRANWLRTAVYIAVLLAVAFLFFVVYAGFHGFQQMQSLYRHKDGFYLSDLPSGAREMADRYGATFMIRCGGAPYFVRYGNPQLDDYGGIVVQAAEMKATFVHNGVADYEKMNGLQDRVSAQWALNGMERRADFKHGRRVSDWGPWGPGSLGTKASVMLIEKNDQWSYVGYEPQEQVKKPPLGCDALGVAP